MGFLADRHIACCRRGSRFGSMASDANPGARLIFKSAKRAHEPATQGSWPVHILGHNGRYVLVFSRGCGKSGMGQLVLIERE